MIFSYYICCTIQKEPSAVKIRKPNYYKNMATIMLPAQEKKKLAKDLEVRIQTVNRALRGEGTSQLMTTIRKVAIERGGCEYNGIRNTNNTDHE